MAGHRDRARLLDGPGPPRRSGRRRLPAGRGHSDTRRRHAVVAMLSLVPWGTNGASLDLMRRSPQSPNGTIELMVSELCLHAEAIGITRISLNFAMFRSAFEQGAQLGAGPVARLWRGLLVFFSRWWQLETLYRSNMKYLPEWVPALRLLRGRPADPARRRRLGDRRGLPRAAVQLDGTKQHTGQHIRRPQTLVSTGGCSTTAAHPTSAGLDASRRRRRGPQRGFRNRCGFGWPS